MSLDNFINYTSIILVLTILYLWKKSRDINYIGPNRILHLETENAGLITTWIKNNVKPNYTNMFEDPAKTATEFLNRLPIDDHKNLDPKRVVFGKNIGRYLNPSDQVAILNLRDLLGIDGEIAIFSNEELRRKVALQVPYFSDTTLKSLISQGLDIVLLRQVESALKYRWDTLKKYLENQLLNDHGSFAYLSENSISNTALFKTPNGYRLNMLCSRLEFDTLITRIKNNSAEYVTLELF